MTLADLRALWDDRESRYRSARYLSPEMAAAVDAHRLAEIRELPGPERIRAYNDHQGGMARLRERTR